MRRLHVLVLAILACALVAAPAQARVKTKEVEKSDAAIEQYWTAERMANAKPAELLVDKAGKVTGKQAHASALASARQIPPPYTGAGTRTNGKVFFSDGGTAYVCSGTAVLSGNRSTVWTAGHCIHDGASGFHTNWAFVPAYADGQRPYGTWTARRLATTSGWANNGDFSYDLGAAAVNLQGGVALTDRVGGRGVAFNYNRSQTYNAHGYPAAPPFNGQRLWVCTSGLRYNDTSANPPTMGISCDMTGGSSGGGWLVGSSVYSVNSYGYRTLRNVMFGPYQGTVAQSLYNQASAM
jgi:V8-like Glu-specific endopeptidase